MPTYDYECTKCHYTFEVFQRISEEPVKVCPECGGVVKRLIGGGTGIIFKGSGFYTTDYKRSGTNSSSVSSGGNGKGQDTSGEASKEKQPTSNKGKDKD